MMIQIIAATIGTVGFAIFLKMRGKQIVMAALGGAITWIVYLLVQEAVEGLFIPYFAASIFVAVYAEIMARVNRAPATIFLTAAAVPLIPGGSLYYTMEGLVNQDNETFAVNGVATITVALAIALGFMLVSVLSRYARLILGKNG